MEKLMLNGSRLEIPGEFAALGDLLEQLKSHVAEDSIITHVFLDDQDVFEQAEETMRVLSLSTVNTVRVVTAPLNRQILDNIAELLNFLKELRPVLRQASRELRFGAVAEASTKLADCFTGLDTAVRNIEQLVPVLPALNAGMSETELASFSKNENDLLGELVKDFTSKDWLSVADRIEFQLDPLMGRWQGVLNRVSGALKASTDLPN